MNSLLYSINGGAWQEAHDLWQPEMSHFDALEAAYIVSQEAGLRGTDCDVVILTDKKRFDCQVRYSSDTHIFDSKIMRADYAK